MNMNKSRLLREEDIIRVVDKHTNDDGSLDNDISRILEEVKENNDIKSLKKELLRHKIALFKMIHQFMYTVTDENGIEYFDDYCESAGEAAFDALGFEHDTISKEEFFKRYDECRTELCEMNGIKNVYSLLECYKEYGDL